MCVHKWVTGYRTLILKLIHNNEIFILLNAHLHNNKRERNNQLVEINGNIEQEIKQHQNINWFIGGDMNFVEGNLDYIGAKRELGSTLMTEIKQITNTIDIGREIYPNKREYTYTDHRIDTKTRLDKIYISGKLQNQTIQSNIHICPYSDHDWASINVKLNFKKMGQWYMEVQ